MEELVNKVELRMQQMGFLPTDTGPFVTELRKLVESENGDVKRSPGTWTTESYTYGQDGFITGYAIDSETRAKSILGIDWALKNGDSYQVRSIDGPTWGYRMYFQEGVMHDKFVIHWNSVKTWLLDQKDLFIWSVGKFWRRKVLKQRNPYT